MSRNCRQPHAPALSSSPTLGGEPCNKPRQKAEIVSFGCDRLEAAAISGGESNHLRERWTADISWGKARAAKGADSCARVSPPCRFAAVETRHVVRRPSSE